ncbi:NAD-dependent epimerase/dehydratase family protein [Falsiroseomonas sp. HW251]|uniref:NAD-dependent epimerase/dehydratase family protein n=1 Tax=Falsiroseomonas sp. HW251 TaxID=3390998 RepID=UPI003D320BC0
MSRLLVTGGAGFIGANLSDRLAQAGHDVVVFDALRRPGVSRNLSWLRGRHPKRIHAAIGDIRDGSALDAALRDVDGVFHLAAQVAVTTSLVEPAEDFAVNLQGTFQLLDLLRRRPGPPCPLVFASTNKVYGDLGDVALRHDGDAWLPEAIGLRRLGVAEDRPLDFHTPYGCSKGAADQYVLDFARSYGMPAAVLRMSCIYGPRQMGTEDQGWVAHFLIRALRDERVTLYGDGAQVRDILHVDDAVAAWIGAWRNMDRVAGRAFNLGGGPANAVSLVQLLEAIGEITGRPVGVEYGPARAGDQRWFVADARAIRSALSLPEPVPWKIGIRHLAEWLAEEGIGARKLEEALR